MNLFMAGGHSFWPRKLIFRYVVAQCIYPKSYYYSLLIKSSVWPRQGLKDDQSGPKYRVLLYLFTDLNESNPLHREVEQRQTLALRIFTKCVEQAVTTGSEGAWLQDLEMTVKPLLLTMTWFDFHACNFFTHLCDERTLIQFWGSWHKTCLDIPWQRCWGTSCPPNNCRTHNMPNLKLQWPNLEGNLPESSTSIWHYLQSDNFRPLFASIWPF